MGKIALFLKELRCEDIRRNFVIHLDSCREVFGEQQEAYCQGIIDCVQILVGLLEMNGKIRQVVEKLK